MKLLRLLVLCFCLASCNDTQKNTDDDDGESSTEQTAEESAREDGPEGTLYLQSYIVNGLSISWLWLGEDGNFVKNPVRGADPIDLNAEKELNAANTGTYTKNGNIISVTYLDGKTENWTMEYLDGKLNTIDGWFAQAQQPLPADYRLDGNFTGNFKIGYIGKQQTYSFRNDGTVSLGSMATVNVDGAGGTAVGQPEKGTYSINGNTLHLNWNNGDKEIALVGVIPGDKPSLIINYSMLMQ